MRNKRLKISLTRFNALLRKRLYWCFHFILITSATFMLGCQTGTVSSDQRSISHGSKIAIFGDNIHNEEESLSNKIEIPKIRTNHPGEFFQRGFAFLLIYEYEKAINDFKIAIGQKKGAIYPESEDKKMIRNFGTRFYSEYAPRRSLGIAYFYLGKLDQAELELKKSNQTMPSDLATDYLDKVLKAKLNLRNDLYPVFEFKYHQVKSDKSSVDSQRQVYNRIITAKLTNGKFSRLINGGPRTNSENRGSHGRMVCEYWSCGS